MTRPRDRASIIEELTGEMPEPEFSRKVEYSGIAVNKVEMEYYYTAEQLREYAAGLVAKAVAAEREACAQEVEDEILNYSESYVIRGCAQAIRNRSNT